MIFSDPLFEGSLSYMSFARTTNLRFEAEILMEFKPSSDTGLLFYIASQLTPYSGDFLAVSLTQGYLELRYSLGKFQLFTVPPVQIFIYALGLSWQICTIRQR